MRPPRILAATMLGAAVVLGSAIPALARDGDVTTRGACSAASVWKLKAAPRDGVLEVQLEVDTPRIGQAWRVVMRNDGVIFFSGTRLTTAPSGSFTVKRTTADGAGRDRITARSVNRVTGEVCWASLSI
jgi:hypothetical protein